MKENDLKNLLDEELMNLYLQGDFAAFEVLYTRHSGRLYEYLKKKVTPEIAQDLLQETFERLHKSRDKYNAQYPFLPWLFTISRNILLDFYKKAETKVSQASNSSQSLLESIIVTSDEHPTHDFSQALNILPQNQKRAIELRYLNEWSFEKISQEIKISEENVRQLVSRGIKKLRLSLLKKGGVK